MKRVCCWSSSGNGGSGCAITCIEFAGDVDAAFESLEIGAVACGSVRRRSIPVGDGLRDDAVVARWTADRATVMTHGGHAVYSGFLAVCKANGVVLQAAISPRVQFPESIDEIEGLMLATLARAQSPAAIDLLLDQPRLWRRFDQQHGADGAPHAGARTKERDAALGRLIEPALVVAVGPANIGKSSLLNALAGRGVSVVADQPGTTRDHVGALIDLAGVVVRWVDTPGLGDSSGSDTSDRLIQQEAQRIALRMAADADLLLVCRDGNAQLTPPPPAHGRILNVGLRADLGAVPDVDVAVSVRDGTGLEELVRAVREALIPREWLEDGLPWRFWDCAGRAENTGGEDS